MPDRDPGVPLRHYLEQHDGVGVLFQCRACMAWHEVPIPRVLARLKVRSLGGEQTGIREIARFAKRPCPRCGAVRWETRPAFPASRRS
jgi:hypothetical protein